MIKPNDSSTISLNQSAASSSSSNTGTISRKRSHTGSDEAESKSSPQRMTSAGTPLCVNVRLTSVLELRKEIEDSMHSGKIKDRDIIKITNAVADN